MACFHPLTAWPPPPGPDRRLVWSSNKSYVGAAPLKLPCGQCRGCRLSKARAWGVRIGHEASMHEANSFLTLTFANEHYPDTGSVSVGDMQRFNKALRNEHRDLRLRFFNCGEYGDRKGRAHYHILVFGYDFPDRVLYKTAPSGHPLYVSAELSKLWPFGLAELGTVTAESGSYVARYCMKKIGGDMADAHYTRPHPLTGEIVTVQREFITMSRRPGIGGAWYDRFRDDAFPSDFLIVGGKKTPVPPFYTRRLKADDEMAALRVTSARKLQGFQHAPNNTPERLAVREEVHRLKTDRLLRGLDADLSS